MGDEQFWSYIDTSLTQSEVGWMVAVKASLFYGVKRNFIKKERAIVSEAQIPMTFNNITRSLYCRVSEKLQSRITLGIDALQCFGYGVTFAGVDIFSHAGCQAEAHESAYAIPIVREIPLRKQHPPLKRSPRGPKNPINLVPPEPEEYNENDLTPDTPARPMNEHQQDALDYVMSLEEPTLDEYLNIDTDRTDIDMD